MSKLHLSLAAFAIAIASAAPALAQDTSGATQRHDMPVAGQKARQGLDAEFHHRMAAMQRAVSEVKMTGDPDQDFVAMMIPHHQGAVAMAKVELEHGKDPELRKLAQDIVKAQEDEIRFMRDWQAKHPK